MFSTRRLAAGAAVALATTSVLAAASTQPAAAADFDTCDLSSKVDELRGWDTNEQYNIVVWKGSSYGSADLQGVVVSDSERKTACGFTNETGEYHWAVFESGSFTLDGDGGYRNWAYYGNVERDGDSHQVTFHQR